jgi:hypothetical protein
LNGQQSTVGTLEWSRRTSGQLSSAERRSFLAPLARAHAANAVGRVSMLLGLNSGRRVRLEPVLDPAPDSVLTRAAQDEAERRLSPALLNHSYRTFFFAAALGRLEDVPVDAELLFAAAMLHDTGLPSDRPDVDFSLSSARVAGDLAEQVGLSTAATTTIRNAITLHHSPGVRLDDGPVAYLLSAGAGVDVIGLRSWQLPPDLLSDVVARHPRVGFKREFSRVFAAEAQQVPRGRARFLRRYAAFDLAIKLAPFRG